MTEMFCNGESIGATYHSPGMLTLSVFIIELLAAIIKKRRLVIYRNCELLYIGDILIKFQSPVIHIYPNLKHHAIYTVV